MGDNMIRKALYLPAKVACTRSKLWRSWFDEQIKTKPAKKVYVQMMVKNREVCLLLREKRSII